MSKIKRFEITDYGSAYYIEIIDHEKELDMSIHNPSQRLDLVECCELLNTQQATIEQLQEENKELKHWKKRMIEYLSDWFEKTEHLSVLYKIAEITNEIGFDSDE